MRRSSPAEEPWRNGARYITYLSYKWPLLDVVYLVEVAFKKGSERIRVKWLGARVRPRSTPKLVSRGPVLRLALLATVDAGTAFANGQRRIFVLFDHN